MCGTLLEKINFDLAIARTDNQVDMRYLINMDYSSDLPINSMGRRVRSRLYFTSESHLHSLLNVLRISSFKEGCVKSPLSSQGQKILADANELCYLTQVVIRLFEDTQKPIDDPKRFRVEIWFSPGATATPMHMEMMYRENDSSRFDTEKLQKISIEGLSCTQVEEYFAEAMKDGKPARDDSIEEPSKSKEGKKKKDKEKKEKGQPKAAKEPKQVNVLSQTVIKEEEIKSTPFNGDVPKKKEESSISGKEVKWTKPTEDTSSKASYDIHAREQTRRSTLIFGAACGAAAIALLLSRGRGKR